MPIRRATTWLQNKAVSECLYCKLMYQSNIFLCCHTNEPYILKHGSYDQFICIYHKHYLKGIKFFLDFYLTLYNDLLFLKLFLKVVKYLEFA